jgi:Methyltransferase domain
VDFDAYLDDLPLLHTWDLGKTWNTGGFNAGQLRGIARIIGTHFGDRPVHILETGAGNSTLTFLQLPHGRLVSIAPAKDLFERILTYCVDHGIDTSRLDYRLERSEIELPALAFSFDPEGSPRPTQFDVVLIDGGHGWPTVMVDFCYANFMMRAGALLLLDDNQLYSIAELSRLLQQQPGFTLLEELGKLQVWSKDDNQKFLPDHSREPYIIEMTKREAK